VIDLWRRKLGPGLRRGDKLVSPAKPAPAVGKPGAGAQSPNYPLVLLAFFVFTAYVVLLPYLGFRISTFLFLVAMPVALERPTTRGRWISVLLLAAIATVAAYIVFERYLHVLLPRGRWTSF
jgi:hypothetical protein